MNPYFFPQQAPFYAPTSYSPLSTMFNTLNFTFAYNGSYNSADPQWRTGKEAVPSPPPAASTPGTGIDTGELRIGRSATQVAGINYSPLIPGYVSRQVIVMFQPGAPPQDRALALSRHMCTEIRTSLHAGFTLASIPSTASVMDTVQSLAMEPAVLYAEPNYYRHAHLVPNDPYYRYQWHLPHMFTNWAWDLARGTGVVVALLDSGVSYRNAAPYALAPDLAGTLITPGWDFVNADATPDDDSGHGTHMCGCIAQTTNNLLGTAGVAFSSTVLAVKVMDSLGNVTVADEADGIYYAANNGAKVINLSLGGVGVSATEEAAVVYAFNQGVILFGSSGNAGSSVPEYPAAYTNCVSVGAVQYDRTRPSYSNYGAELDLVAPGGNITVDQNLDGYADGILQQTHDGTTLSTFFYYFMEGTSPACALASGVAALVIDKATVVLTPLQVRNIMESNTIDLGAIGWDQYFGWGEINAYAAVLNAP
ncbi:MAG: S8 family serine peptidase [bacterium]